MFFDNFSEGHVRFGRINPDGDTFSDCCLRNNDDVAWANLNDAVALISQCFDFKIDDIALLGWRLVGG